MPRPSISSTQGSTSRSSPGSMAGALPGASTQMRSMYFIVSSRTELWHRLVAARHVDERLGGFTTRLNKETSRDLPETTVGALDLDPYDESVVGHHRAPIVVPVRVLTADRPVHVDELLDRGVERVRRNRRELGDSFRDRVARSVRGRDVEAR